MSRAAVTSVYGVGWFLYRADGVYVMLSSVSNIGLCVSVYMSFVRNLSLLILYMLYLPNVFKCFPFSSVFIMSILLVILLYTCSLLSMWVEYPELL
jgi:hypothetical protein